jgi:hypothetical protein
MVLATVSNGDIMPRKKTTNIQSNSMLEIRVHHIPSGMTLLLLDYNGRLLSTAKENEVLRVHTADNIYGGYINKSLKTNYNDSDKQKFYKLKTILKSDMPSNNGTVRQPGTLNCSVVEKDKTTFTLQCSNS